MAPATKRLPDLPVELFDTILAEAVQVRSLKRAFRLRLVNGFFAAAIPRAVHECRLLDDSNIRIKLLGSAVVDYLWRRLAFTNLPVAFGWDRIRRISAQLALEDDEGVQDESMAKICLQLPEFSLASIGSGLGKVPFESDTLRAAAYFNNLSIIEECTKCPRPFDVWVGLFDDWFGSFGDPFTLAILGGHGEALGFILSKIPSCEVDNCKIKVLPCAIEQGSMEMVNRVLPDSMLPFLGLISGSDFAKDYFETLLQTPSVEIFEKIMSITKATTRPYLDGDCLDNLLRTAARNGWLNMLRHLLPSCKRHKDINICMYRTLMTACAHGHNTMVHLLLDYGVKMTGDEIRTAAYEGRWDVVKTLLQYGADINGGWQRWPDLPYGYEEYHPIV